MIMKKEEIALDVVSRVTGVSRKAILSRCRVYRNVEARQLLVLLLYSDGFNDGKTALFLDRTRESVLKSRHAAFDTRDVSRAFREKFTKALELYEQQKSLRVAQA